MPRGPCFFSIQMGASFQVLLCTLFFWLLASEFSFSLNLQLSSSGLLCVLYFLGEEGTLSSSSYTAPFLEGGVMWRRGPRKHRRTLRCRWQDFKFTCNNQLVFFFFLILKDFFFSKEKNLIMHKRNSLRINSLGIKSKKGKDVSDPFKK